MEKSYHLHCTGNCDNQVIWGDGSNFSTSGDYEVMSLSRGTRCVDIQNYARAPYLNDLRGSACNLLRTKTICQIPCEKGNFCIHGTYLNDAVSSSPYTVPSECPEDFPFATGPASSLRILSSAAQIISLAMTPTWGVRTTTGKMVMIDSAKRKRK